MSVDEGNPGARDLTPGDFHVNGGSNVEVETDSLGGFGRTYWQDLEMGYQVSAGLPIQMMSGDVDKDAGSRAIGNDRTFYELWLTANWISTSAQSTQELASDLYYGNVSLANAAMYMAEKYRITDGFNAVGTAEAVNGAFNPAAGETRTVAHERATREADAAARTAAAEAALANIDGSDRRFYNMEGAELPTAPTVNAVTGGVVQPAAAGDTAGDQAADTEDTGFEEFADMPDADTELYEPRELELAEPATPEAGFIPAAGNTISDAASGLVPDPRSMRPGYGG
ncbi:MAG: hypothetical protein ACRDT4_26155 [Micromonosporaceae bacterium]